MLFPDKIIVVARSSTTGEPVDGVSFVLVLRALAKNDYSVGPMVTDSDGVLEITREDCQNTIKRAQEMFIMDYSGDLSSCGPIAELKMQPPEQVVKTIKQFESAPSFWGRGFDNPTSLMTALREAKNARFEPSTIKLNEADLRRNQKIEVRLKPLA